MPFKYPGNLLRRMCGLCLSKFLYVFSSKLYVIGDLIIFSFFRVGYGQRKKTPILGDRKFGTIRARTICSGTLRTLIALI